MYTLLGGSERLESVVDPTNRAVPRESLDRGIGWELQPAAGEGETPKLGMCEIPREEIEGVSLSGAVWWVNCKS
jgi:hypothetical protein